MSTIKVVSMTGAEVGSVELNDAIFGIEPNMSVVHEVVKNHLANCRQGTQSALTRAEVSGGGRKPWRQKGTGRARQGSTRAPQWTHGGIVFAPKPRSYSYVLNKKVKRLALKSVLSAKAAQGEIVVVDKIALDAIKTKDFRSFLSAVKADGKAAVITPEVNEVVVKSARNLPGVTSARKAHQRLRSAQRQDPRDRQGSPRSHRGGVRVMANVYDIIIRPIITERSMVDVANKKYVFEVAKDAGKVEIKNAVETAFGVKVAKVNTLNVSGKAKRLGAGRLGKTRSWKKAYVQLAEDSKTIELFEGMV